MSSTADVCIIGGGVIGLTAAYYLAKEGVPVTLLDKGDLGQESSWAGAGIISPGNPKRARSPIGLLRARSAAMYPQLSSELRERTGIDNGYLPCGGLELLQSTDELERRRVAQVVREEREGGASGQLLDADELRRIEPGLSADLPGAVHFPGIAQVRNPRHLHALIMACEQLGVRFLRHCPVREFVKGDGRINAVKTSNGELRADKFLLASGAWTETLLASVGWQPGIHPVRGQIVLIHASPSPIQKVIQAGSRYLVPRDDGRILAGSTEENVGFDHRTTEDAVRMLAEFARRTVPLLESAVVERAWAGLRPASADGRPILGSVPGWENLFVAVGHFRSGIMLSPITGLLMKELILGQPLSVPIDAFRLDRMAPDSAAPRAFSASTA